jgi:OHCU decarboxylase
VNSILTAWNKADDAAAFEAMTACCGARRWAAAMVASRPIGTVVELSETADRLWSTMGESDCLEAFACHPRIGGRKAADHGGAQSSTWSQQEQSQAGAAGENVLIELAKGNQAYEERFGFTYIVCATGKSAEEMLTILRRRLQSDRATEIREAAGQQRQIMQIRLGKWLME